VTDVYVGHTVDIAKRASQHEKCSKTSGCRVYAFIREHGLYTKREIVINRINGI